MKLSTLIFVIVVALGFILPLFLFKEHDKQWVTRNGKSYWYDNNKILGRKDDPENLIDENSHMPLGRELYLRSDDAWYWLDASNDGARAEDREVRIPYIYQDQRDTGEYKYVYYGSDGKMLKGWQMLDGKYYYFYPVTGEKYFGTKEIEGTSYHFNDATGELDSFYDTDFVEYEAAILVPMGGDMHVVTESIRRDQHDTFTEKMGYTRYFSKATNVIEVSPEEYGYFSQSSSMILFDLDKTMKIYSREAEGASIVSGYYVLDCVQDNRFYIISKSADGESPGSFPVQFVQYKSVENEAPSTE